jgi:catechol 2,3-dioxygenase-like lactoylglutathione lyase family enzyme
MRKLLLLAGLATSAFAQLPDFYKSVDRVAWVVKDLQPVIAGWERLHLTAHDYGVMEHQAVFRGRSVTVKTHTAGGRIGGLEVNWVQPLGGENAYTEFLAKHGDGIFSLVHRVPSRQALEAEAKRMSAAGVGVLQRATIETEAGAVTYVHFDTEPQGKYSLGLIFLPPTIEENLPESKLSKVTQFAFVTHDLRAVSAYWHKLGFPEMSIEHDPLTDLVYRGKPGHFDQELGWQRHGKVVYEWIRPLKGPTVYEEQFKAHGEGLHHLAFDVRDMEKGIATWTAPGYVVAQSGAWGEKNQPGSGRFAYIDTSGFGGVTAELLWNYRP